MSVRAVQNAMRRRGLSHDLARVACEALVIEPPAFAADALCAQTDPDLFFPDKGGTPRLAKRICGGCPVITECLAYGIDDEYGVWGGTTRNERMRIRRASGDVCPHCRRSYVSVSRHIDRTHKKAS